MLAAALAAPPFVVGVALVSIGTDLPEIANSVASHVQGAGAAPTRSSPSPSPSPSSYSGSDGGTTA